MPSSHGGGSFGGGGGGSFSSGGSHGPSSTPHFSAHKRLPGCTMYYFIDTSGVRRTFYHKGSPVRKSLWQLIGVYSIVFLAVLILCSIAAFSMIIPHKLSSKKCNPISSCIIDNANVINEDVGLEESLNAFYKKSGSQAVVYTQTIEYFENKIGSLSQENLEDYAYDVYMDLFDDEGHWLIVVVTDGEEGSWVDMAGNETGFIITDSFFEKFQSEMQTNLNDTSITKSQALKNSFDYATENILKLSMIDVVPIILYFVFVIFILFALGHQIYNGVIEYITLKGYCTYRDEHGGVDFSEDSEELTHEQEVDVFN